MRENVALIICYFGKLPNYFQLWLDSCTKNPDFTWLLFTNDKNTYRYPDNVKRYLVEQEYIVDLIKEKCNISICIRNSYKLCDFRPLYGMIFSDYLEHYTHWGYCDVDVIWGRLNSFITPDLLQSYDKIFNHGHLTIYKNLESVNQYFKIPYSGINYKTVLSTSKHFGFDESRGINAIYDENSLCQYKNVCFADINFCHYGMIMNGKQNLTRQFFLYKNGNLFRCDRNGNLIDEFAYIHLQKRKMKVFITEADKEFYILSDGFYSQLKRTSLWREIVNDFIFKCKAYSRLIENKIKWNLDWRYSLIKSRNRRHKG